MSKALEIIEPNIDELSIEKINIGIVVSNFHADITNVLLTGAIARLKEQGLMNIQRTIVRVPGAVEIPFALQQLAQKKLFDGLIAFGAVIYGETPHFDYVCQSVTTGCQQVSLTEEIPVIFGVLTTKTHQQALDRIGGSKGHMGIEAANSLLAMLSIRTQIDSMKG